LLVTGLVWLAGCAQIGAPLPPSLELPKAPSDLRAARKGDKVTLTWTIPPRTTDRQRVRYLGKTRVCRSLDPALVDPALVDPGHKQCDAPIGEVAPPADFAATNKSSGKKLTASFIDALSSAMEQANPAGSATYAVEVLNAAGRSAGISNLVHVALVPTLPPFSGFSAQPTPQGVLISWQCPPMSGRRTGVKYVFRIYRRAEAGAGTRIAEIDVTECAAGPGGLVTSSGAATSVPAAVQSNSNGCVPEEIPRPAGENAGLRDDAKSEKTAEGSNCTSNNVPHEHDKLVTSFLDQTFEWEKTYFYRGVVVSVVEAAGKPAVEVEGDDTPELKVWAHDVFPPAVPTGLQAVFSGPGQAPFIDLIWAPVTDADLDGYNIYRNVYGEAAVRLNTEPVKVPAYRDLQVVGGKTYFYSVSAVDSRGNESGRSEAASESVP